MVRVRRPDIRPIVTYTLLGVTILFYLLQEMNRMGLAREPFEALATLIFGPQLFQQLLENGWGDSLPTLLGSKISPLIMAGQYWRLITPMLLHGSLMHVGFNMYALFVIGPSLERFYGHNRFLALYLLGALGGNIMSFLMNPGPTPSVGASTAIFGLVAAEGVFLYQNRAVFGPQARAMLNNVIMVVVINLALGLTPGIDNWGHLGGLITGLAFGWFAGPRLEVTYNYPEYELSDQRSQGMSWLIALVILAALIGIAFLRIMQMI